jgi:hypothetical protein
VLLKRHPHPGLAQLPGSHVELGAAGDLPRGAAQDPLPFELHRNFVIVVRGSIGELSGLTFLIDTGAAPTVVDAALAVRLKLTGAPASIVTLGGSSHSQQVQLPAVRLGPFRVERARALTADLSGLKARFGVVPDVNAGVELLRGACIVIDYLNRSLHFERRAAWPAVVPLDRVSPHLIVQVEIDRVRLRLAVDTGAEAVTVFDAAAPAVWDARVEGEVAAGDLFGVLRLRRMVARVVSIGPARWRQVPVHLARPPVGLGHDGVLGPRALGVERLQLDLERMQMSWEPLAARASAGARRNHLTTPTFTPDDRSGVR